MGNKNHKMQVPLDCDQKAMAGNLSLLDACRQNNIAAAMLAVKNRRGTLKSCIEQRDDNGFTPLLIGAMLGEVELVKLLLRYRAQVDARDRLGNTPLILAATKGHTAVVSLLIKHKANVNATNKEGYPALVRAAAEGRKEIVVELLKNAAKPDFVNNFRGYTALFCAANGGHDQVVNLLIDAEADVNHTSGLGESVLMAAASSGHKGVIRSLIKAHATLNETDNEGDNAIHYAIGSNNAYAVIVLLAGHLYQQQPIKLSNPIASDTLKKNIEAINKYLSGAIKGSLMALPICHDILAEYQKIKEKSLLTTLSVEAKPALIPLFRRYSSRMPKADIFGLANHTPKQNSKWKAKPF